MQDKLAIFLQFHQYSIANPEALAHIEGLALTRPFQKDWTDLLVNNE